MTTEPVRITLSDVAMRCEELRQKRLLVGRNRDRIKAVYQSMPYDKEVGDREVSMKPLIDKLNEAIEQRRENDKKVDQLEAAEAREQSSQQELDEIAKERANLAQQIFDLQWKECEVNAKVGELQETLRIIKELREGFAQEVAALVEPPIGAIKAQMEAIEQKNKVVAANLANRAKYDEYLSEAKKYEELTERIRAVDAEYAAMVQKVISEVPAVAAEYVGDVPPADDEADLKTQAELDAAGK